MVASTATTLGVQLMSLAGASANGPLPGGSKERVAQTRCSLSAKPQMYAI